MDARRRRLLASAALASLPGLAAPAGAAGPEHVLRQTRIHRRQDGHADWRVTLRLPAGAPPAEGWPVIYLLDGNAALAALREHESLAAGLAVAAVGYDTAARFDTASRAWDYTPLPPGARDAAPDPRARERLNGGADRFLDFLLALHAELSAQWPIDAQRRTLYGHSYGGLFVLHTLLARPQTYDRYVAASPSLWWHAPLMTQRIAGAPQRPAGMTPASLLVLAGGEERVRQQRCARCTEGTPTQGQAERFVAALSERPDLHAQLRVLPGLTHGEMLAAALPWALRLAGAARG